MMLRSISLLMLLQVSLSSSVWAGEIFKNSSGEYRTALLELYTSEGCSSCPPTEAWLGRLEAEGFSRDRVIPIALHVDYWDYIGWKDPYANATHTLRQLDHQRREGFPSIYTPQLILNGKDLRPRRALKKRLPEITESPATVDLSLLAEYVEKEILKAKVSLKWLSGAAKNGSLFLVLTEDGLEKSIDAGENAGRTLKHERVVRSVKEALPLMAESDVSFSINSEWDKSKLGLVAFVEADNGDILQAVELRLH